MSTTTIPSQQITVHSIATLYPSVYHSSSLANMPQHPHQHSHNSHEPEIILRTPRSSRFQPAENRKHGSGKSAVNGSQSARSEPLPDISSHSRPPPITAEQYFLNPSAAAPHHPHHHHMQQIGGSPPPPPMPFISSSDSQLTTQQLSAKLNQNMLSNAARSPQAAAALTTPLSPRVARAVQSHQTSHVQQQQLFPPPQQNTALPHSPMRPGIAPGPVVSHANNGQAFFSFQSNSPQHATNGQLVLPAEFVAQQQAKLLAQKQAELRKADGGAPTAERDAQILQQAKALVDNMLYPPFLGSNHYDNPHSPSRSPRRSPRHDRSHSSPMHAKIVPARVPDVAYGNMKKRSTHLLQQFKHAATETSSRASAVQLEMRGSVRFDMSNPDKIFEALRKQAEKPVADDELNFNEKHTIMNKDGTQTVVFGRLHERPDSVREASISEFFVAKAANTNMPTLERFVSQNYNKDRNRMQKEFAQKHGPGAQNKRKERTEEELLAAPDEELTPLEKWKRDQLRIKQAKAEAQEAAMREHRARQNELLKLRLEKERFEREEREQYEKEQAIKAAKEEEERLWRESEKQRLYRETVQEQAAENKLAKAEAEQAKKRREEEEARKREEDRKRKMGEGGFSYMKPLTKASRTAEEEVLLARVKDTEKDWAIARAKFKAEITRVGELVQRREKSQQKMLGVAARLAEKESTLEGTMSNVVSAEETAAKFRDNSEFKDSIRKLRMNNLQATEENRLRELEKIENECRLAYEKASSALEAAEIKAANAGSETSFGRSTTFTKRPPGGAGGTLSTSNSQAILSHVASVRSIRSGADSDRGIDEEQNHHDDDNVSNAGDDAGSEASTAAPSVAGSPVKARRTRRNPASGDPNASPHGHPRSSSGAASRSGSKSRAISPSADRDGASPATKSRRASVTAADMNHLNLEGDRWSAAASGATSEAVSPPISGVVSPAAGTEGDVAAAGPAGEGEEPAIVNERTMAIDAARAQMVSQQAEFEARIKALTSFSTPPSGKKKTRKASISVSKQASPPAANPRRATAKPKKNSILPVFNKEQINPNAQGRSPDASDGEDDADAKLMRSLALADVEEQLTATDAPAQ